MHLRFERRVYPAPTLGQMADGETGYFNPNELQIEPNYTYWLRADLRLAVPPKRKRRHDYLRVTRFGDRYVAVMAEHSERGLRSRPGCYELMPPKWIQISHIKGRERLKIVTV